MPVAEEDRLYRRYHLYDRPKKNRRPYYHWPWPALSTFELRADEEGLSVDDGAIWGPKDIRSYLGRCRRPNNPEQFKNSDEFGLVVLSRESLISPDPTYEVRPDPVEATDLCPENPAHALVVKPVSMAALEFEADLWGRSLGFEPPPQLDLAPSQWAQWELIAFGS